MTEQFTRFDATEFLRHLKKWRLSGLAKRMQAMESHTCSAKNSPSKGYDSNCPDARLKISKH